MARVTKRCKKVAYSEFLQKVKSGNVASVTVEDRVIKGMLKDNSHFTTYLPLSDPYLLSELISQKVKVVGQAPQQQSFLMHIFINWFPMLLLIGVWIFFMRQMQGGGGRGAMSFGRSRARLLSEDQVKVTFDDVAGCEEAKEEVAELVEFLRDTAKFQRLGGKFREAF